jgi:hypothetical protein
VTGNDRRTEITRVRAGGILERMHVDDVRRLRRLAIEFYEGTSLFELEVGLAGARSGALEFLRKGDVLTVLDGRAANIYEFNAVAPVRLDTVPRAAAYLRFFLASVQCKTGLFRVVDDASALPWAPPGPNEAVQAQVAQAVRQWRMDPSAAGGWNAEGTVAYDRSLLRAAFQLRNNGMVNLVGQEQLTSALPLRVERFEASGLRVAADADPTR